MRRKRKKNPSGPVWFLGGAVTGAALAGLAALVLFARSGGSSIGSSG